MTIKSKPFSWKSVGISRIYKPHMCFMELTYRCPLNCRHCYLNCSNKFSFAEKELSTKQIKYLLDKCKKDGVLWLVFTGGDPLIRKDFVELYTYACKLGFIVGVFTSLVPLNRKILNIFKRYRPFKIVTTLDAASPQKYFEITRSHLFRRHIKNIKILLKNNLHVEVKTLITKSNIEQIEKIKDLIESMNLRFQPSVSVTARVNGDVSPCLLRLEPAEAAKISMKYESPKYELDSDSCLKGTPDLNLVCKPITDGFFYLCEAGTYSFIITPQGKMIICQLLRKPDYDLLKESHTIEKGFRMLNDLRNSLHFTTHSRCRRCHYRRICNWCPAYAYLEKGDFEKPIEYYCRLTEETVKALLKKTK